MPGESELILRDMSDGVIVIDAKGRLTTVNPAARALLELGDGALSESFAGLFIGDRRNDGFVQAILNALQAAGEPGSRVTDYFTKRDQKRKVSVKATFTHSDSGEKELIAVLSDVTDRENAIVFRKDVTILVSILVILVCLFFFAYKFIDDYFPGAVAPSAMTYGLLFALLIMSVFIRLKTSLRPKIVFRGEAARKAMWNGVLLSGCAIAVMIAIKYILLKTGSPLFSPEAAFFNFSRFTAKELYRYLPCVLMQEFLARNILQEGFIYVYGERYGGLAILVSSLVFGAVHLPYSITVMVAATLLLGALGLFYQKTRNLISVTIVHYCAAEAAMILGFL